LLSGNYLWLASVALPDMPTQVFDPAGTFLIVGKCKSINALTGGLDPGTLPRLRMLLGRQKRAEGNLTLLSYCSASLMEPQKIDPQAVSD
jgi:hypothetical protein